MPDLHHSGATYAVAIGFRSRSHHHLPAGSSGSWRGSWALPTGVYARSADGGAVKGRVRGVGLARNTFVQQNNM